MKYVLDASAGFKWVIVEPFSDKARQLRDDYRNAIHELLAPDLFPVEIGNALLVAARRGVLQPAQGPALLADVLRTLPRMHPSLPLLPRSYEMAAQTRASVYDCLYVALAERDGCQPITADDRLVRSLQPAFPFVISLASFP